MLLQVFENTSMNQTTAGKLDLFDVLKLLPDEEENACAIFYRKALEQAIKALLPVLHAANISLPIRDLGSLMVNGDELLNLENRLKEICSQDKVLAEYTLYLDKYRTIDGLDMKVLKDALGHFDGRVFL